MTQVRIASWLFFVAATAAACGDATGPAADVPADRDDAASDPGDSTGGDADADGDVADAEPDVVEDVPADSEPEVEPDAEPDATPDTVEDAIEEVQPDAPGETTDATDVYADGWTDVTVTLTDATAYVDLMPGGPPTGIIAFSLHVANAGTADATGFVAVSADANDASDGSTFFSVLPALTLSGGGAFSGVIPAGGFVDLEGHGTLEDAPTGICGNDAKVVVEVTWSGAPNISRSSDAFSVTCPS